MARTLEFCFNYGSPTTHLATAGLDPAHIDTRICEASVKQGLIDNTEAAGARGAFGAPTIFVGNEIFFGCNRMDYVKRALAA